MQSKLSGGGPKFLSQSFINLGSSPSAASVSTRGGMNVHHSFIAFNSNKGEELRKTLQGSTRRLTSGKKNE